MPHPRDLTPDALLLRLPAAERALLAQAAGAADGYGARLWLVGGVIRDALLDLPPGRDIDLAVEGGRPELFAALAAILGGRVLASHGAFGTATLLVNGLVLDLAQTRAERYPRPAALPEVWPAPIADDLARRDFSLNAIALELRADGAAGALLDPHHGRDDLAARRLRLLHPASLRDDPTRILRGLRLAARLDLLPDPQTQAQLDQALQLGYLGLLTPERVLGELCLALEEPRPDQVLRLAGSWGVSPQILPGLGWGEALADRSERFAAEAAGTEAAPLIWLGLLAYDARAAALADLPRRYPLPTAPAGLLRELVQLRAIAPLLAEPRRPSELDRLLRPYTAPAIAVLHYAAAGPAGVAAGHYLREIRPVAAPLDGHDLRRLGVVPGPRLGRLLEALRAAHLDGLIGSRAEAERWVRDQIAR